MKKIIYGMLLALILGSVFTSCASTKSTNAKAPTSAETGDTVKTTEKNAK